MTGEATGKKKKNPRYQFTAAAKPLSTLDGEPRYGLFHQANLDPLGTLILGCAILAFLLT
jgi:hypothetical protein